jgi:hypothetical protein
MGPSESVSTRGASDSERRGLSLAGRGLPAQGEAGIIALAPAGAGEDRALA